MDGWMDGWIYIFVNCSWVTPGSSSTIRIYTQTIRKRTQLILGRVWAVPRLYELYPGICLTTEEKARKNLSQGTDKRIKHIKCTEIIGFCFDGEIT
jgi:hypothetical protein